jgi:hypothetical protein
MEHLLGTCPLIERASLRLGVAVSVAKSTCAAVAINREGMAAG